MPSSTSKIFTTGLSQRDFHNGIFTTGFSQLGSNQIDLLWKGKTQDLDVPHLIAEFDDMGKGSLRELESRSITLIAHLLKWQFQFETWTEQW